MKGEGAEEEVGVMLPEKDLTNVANFEEERKGAISQRTWAAFRGWKRQGNGLPLELPEER